MHKTQQFIVGGWKNEIKVTDHGDMTFRMSGETYGIDTGSHDGETIYTLSNVKDRRTIFYGFEDGDCFEFISAGDTRRDKNIVKAAAQMIALIL